MNENIRTARILIVDDNEDNVAVIEQMLRKAGYSAVSSTTDSRKAVSLVSSIRPDLLILDLMMPAPDGYAILDDLAVQPDRDKLMPIVVLTGDVVPSTRVKVLSMGAKEFLTKPVDRVDLLLRTRNLLDLRWARLLAREEAAKRAAAERTSGEAGWEREVLYRLGRVFEWLDPARAATGERVAELSVKIAAEMKLEPELREQLRTAAPLFDIGILSVPEHIRNSTGRLTPEERQIMKGHAGAGWQLFAGTPAPMLEIARDIAGSHHERWDGAGYPAGLQGTEIPLAARIVGVAQTYDAMVSRRAYRDPVGADEALNEVQRQAKFAFDPDVVDALVRTLGVGVPVGAIDQGLA